MLLQSDFSVPKATSNALRCWHEGKEKSKSSIPVCIWELVQWCRKLTCFDCSNYWCYKYSCSRRHIQKGSIMGKKEKKNKQTKKTSNLSHSPKQYHICLDMGSSVPIDWNKMSGKSSDSRKPLEPVQHILHEWMNECKHRDYCKREIQSKFCSTITETVSI